VPWPQSIVPDSHMAVQDTAAQSGAFARVVHDVGWQHCAGTQSEATPQVPGLGGRIGAALVDGAADVVHATKHPLGPQRQAPAPQSIVPPRHSSVQEAPLQSGAFARVVHYVGWQHCAGTHARLSVDPPLQVVDVVGAGLVALAQKAVHCPSAV